MPALRKPYDTGIRLTDRDNSNDMFLAPRAGSAFFEAFCRGFFRYYCQLVVEGRNWIPDSPFIICSNHTSHVDSAVLMTASGFPFSEFALLGARDYFFYSWRARLLVSRFMNVIPIDRQAHHKSIRRSLEMCEEFVLRTHGNLILYPEGTRSLDGEMQPFKSGAGLFAFDLGVPVVPAYIDGAHSILAKGKVMPRRAPVTVHFGEPIVFKSNQSGSQWEPGRRRAAVQLLERSIHGLKPRLSAEGETVPSREEQQPAVSNVSTVARESRKAKAFRAQ
jgi:1-acyl-sn-glycerol-3-phosphate acyltransferase